MDFSLLPTESFFSGRPLLTPIDQTLDARLITLSSVRERAQSAVMFSEQAAKADENWTAAYLRAALADMVSMEEVQALDRPAHQPLKVKDSKNPLVHLLALIRHLNIHVKSVMTSTQAVSASFHDHNFEMNVHIVDNVNVGDLQALKNGRHYSFSDLSCMLDWFRASQMHWGAGYVVRVGAEAYASEIATHHGA